MLDKESEKNENTSTASDANLAIHGMMHHDRAEGTSSSNASGNPSAVVFSECDSYAGDLERLKGRGFLDWDSKDARFLIERVTYRHLSPYLAIVEDSCQEPRLTTAYHLFGFDRRLQSLLFKYVGILEGRMRAQYSHWMEVHCGPYSIYEEDRFLRRDKHASSINRLKKEVVRRKERRVKKILETNGGKLPVWEAVEFMTFGTLSQLFSNTANKNVTNAVSRFFSANKDELASWLRSICAARNALAHFEPFAVRKQLVSVPMRIRGISFDNRKPFYLTLLLARLLRSDAILLDAELRSSGQLKTDMEAFMRDLGNEDAEMAKLLGVPANWLQLIGASLGELAEPDETNAWIPEECDEEKRLADKPRTHLTPTKTQNEESLQRIIDR